MNIPDRVETVATIRAVLSERTCHAMLPNEKVIFGFIDKDLPAFPLHLGGRVRVQLNVADFSRGEMLEPV
jgi:hypothetical protein